MITKAASIEANFRKNVWLTEAARIGWGEILKSLPKDASILLPSYIGITDREGSGIYDPVTDIGVAHDFYPLDDRLDIPVPALESMLAKKKYALILLVHYFGFKIRNIQEVVDVCRRHGVVIVEDCAHLYNYGQFDSSKAGTYGDFAFYSLHKFFPLSYGGLLVQHNPKTLPKLLGSFEERPELAEAVLAYDVARIIKRRRENYKIFSELISKVESVKLLRELGDEDIPQSLPVIIKDGLREKLYFWLMDREMPTIALYYRLIDQLDEKHYKQMHNISNNILNLPIHQDVTKEDMENLTQEIMRFYEST